MYVKGGGAWIDVKESITGFGLADDGGRVRTGSTARKGWEYAFAPNWSVKLEYNYMDFGTKATNSNALSAFVRQPVSTTT